MAVRRILRYPDPFLRKRSEDASLDAAVLADTWHDMEDTLMEADGGAALAAPQVGVGLRMIAVNQLATLQAKNDPAAYAIPPIVVNPVLVSHGPESEVADEGCLSFPGIVLTIRRWRRVVVRYNTPLHWEGTRDVEWLSVQEAYEGFWARMFQHELDHLDGKLFVDSLPQHRRVLIAKSIQRRQR